IANPLRFYSATATDPNGNTSEFSPNANAISTAPGQAYIVTATDDSGPGSLRQAILDANAAFNSGDTITFSIPGTGAHTILPSSALPAISDPVTIDGFSQPGAKSNSSADGFNATLQIKLLGTNAGINVDGLRINSSNSVVRGLAIAGFKGDGLELGI